MMLDEIIKNKRTEVKELKGSIKLPDVSQLPPLRDFASAVSKKGLSLIAEVKAASPSAGTIIGEYDPASIARTYEKAGASAISVLTDSKYFGGAVEHIRSVKAAVKLPVLRKDFVIDIAQIYESRAAGADAVLLIARILKVDQLDRFVAAVKELGMTPLVEVHSVQEARTALKSGADVIGINNRDLDTLKVDLDTTADIIGALPKLKQKIIVSESGIKSREDVSKLKEAGVNAVLVGEALLRSGDIAAKLKELIS